MYTVYYIADFDLSMKNASSRRIINNCKGLTYNSQIKVEIIGSSFKNDFYQEGFFVRNIKASNHFVKKYLNILTKGFLFVKKIKQIPNADCIIYYGVSSIILLPLLRYCKKKKIKLIVDVVEWYDYRNLKYGKFGPFTMDVHLAMTWIIPKCKNAIVISSFLEQHFSKKEMNLLRVPPLIDTQERGKLIEEESLSADSSFINLIYAGFPGKKDMIAIMVSAVERLNLENVRVKLHIIGPTEFELKNLLSTDFSGNIICYGRMDQELVPVYLNLADFSLLLRKNERYAEAGFPTKFVESMNAGLPVISNLTSDLKFYLKDNYNGFVIEDCTEESIVKKIKQISDLPLHDIQAMKINAKNTAVENFDYRLFSNEFKSFVIGKNASI